MTPKRKTALVIGGSRGVGRGLSLKLHSEGFRTIAVARTARDLDALATEAPEIETYARNAAEDSVAQELVSELRPDYLFLVGGAQPKMSPLAEQTWEEFSHPWNVDTRIAFDFTKAALLVPMPSGGKVVSFASGAAISGSRLSGGYAGAKRMQHLVSQYGQSEAGRLGLDLSFYTIYPKQLIEGTEMGLAASAAYAASTAISSEQFMGQWEKPLTAELTAEQVVALLTHGGDGGVFAATGTGMEAMA